MATLRVQARRHSRIDPLEPRPDRRDGGQAQGGRRRLRRQFRLKFRPLAELRDAVPKGPEKPDRLRQVDAEDHQGDADGRGLEAAPRAERGRGGASLRRESRAGARQSRRRRSRRARRRRRCLRAAARTRRTSWWCAPASAGFAAPSTRRSCAWRANAPTRSSRAGKTVKIVCVGKKGYDQLRRTHEQAIIEQIDLRGARTIAFADRAADRREGDRSLRGRGVRRLHAVLRPLQVGRFRRFRPPSS